MVCSMATIDLRSDTVTKPTDGMRAAMASAEVGDDCYREDASVLALEERVAELLGKEASLFVPSGTMANQIALQIHARPGDEVIIGKGAHLYYYEGGAGGAFAGVQFVECAEALLCADDIEEKLKPSAYYLPQTALVAVENTHNRSGGRVYPRAQLRAVSAAARAHDLAVHMDGARIWNAAVATDVSVAALCEPMDTVAACFSKGLGAPIGSVIAGSKEHIARALILRRRFGGAMRQVGILAAAATYALDHHLPRLHEDHAVARALGVALKERGLVVTPVETNIVCFDTEGDAFEVAERARAGGVLVNAIGPKRIRAVTHREVSRSDVARAAEVLCG